MASTSEPAPGQTVEALAEQVAAQNAVVNELKKQDADAAAQEEAKKRLGELKKNLALLQHAAGAGGKGEKKKERMLLKTAKVCVRSVCGAWGLRLISRLLSSPILCVSYMRDGDG